MAQRRSAPRPVASPSSPTSRVRAHRADEVPERLHCRGNGRIGDLVLVLDSAQVVWPVRDRPPSGGFTHGWDNALLSMRALFVAAGRGLPMDGVVQ